MAPIKIYLGMQIEQSLAVDVLSYSIRAHTRSAVEITPLYEAVAAADIQIPTPSAPHLRPRTPFTFQRFAIPALCHYQGRAIYLDSDMLVFKDINELWQQPFTSSVNPEIAADLLSVPEPACSNRPPQYSVMLLNCEQLHWDAPQLLKQLEAGEWSYEQFVIEMASAAQKSASLPAGWNDLERYTSGQTALIHYTDMPRQPWLSTANPLCGLWCDVLLQAIAANAISRETVCDAIQRGWVRPSLLVQIDSDIANPQDLPAQIRARDRQTFTPPHIWQRYLRHPALQNARSRHGSAEPTPLIKRSPGPISRHILPLGGSAPTMLENLSTESSNNLNLLDTSIPPEPRQSKSSAPNLNTSEPHTTHPEDLIRIRPLYFLCVNYHSAALVSDLMHTLEDNQGIIIVNNSPTDRAIHALQSSTFGGGQVTVIDAPNNGGFGAGCNLGLQRICARSPQAIIWVINPDASIVSGAIAQVRRCLCNDPSIAILGTPVLDSANHLWFGSGRWASHPYPLGHRLQHYLQLSAARTLPSIRRSLLSVLRRLRSVRALLSARLRDRPPPPTHAPSRPRRLQHHRSIYSSQICPWHL